MTQLFTCDDLVKTLIMIAYREFILYNMDVETVMTNIGDYPFPTWIIREE